MREPKRMKIASNSLSHSKEIVYGSFKAFASAQLIFNFIQHQKPLWIYRRKLMDFTTINEMPYHIRVEQYIRFATLAHYRWQYFVRLFLSHSLS